MCRGSTITWHKEYKPPRVLYGLLRLCYIISTLRKILPNTLQIMTVTQSLIGCGNSAGDRKRKVRSLVITGGCTVRSNVHPSPSNTIRCFPSLGFLPFQQEGQFSVCLQMWKYTVYVYECMHAHVNSAFKHACLAPFMPVCMCRWYKWILGCLFLLCLFVN